MWDVENYREATITVNGETFSLSPGASFPEQVSETAREMGLSKVRVFLVENGVEEEVSQDDAPAFVEEGMEVIVRPYEKAA